MDARPNSFITESSSNARAFFSRIAFDFVWITFLFFRSTTPRPLIPACRGLRRYPRPRRRPRNGPAPTPAAENGRCGNPTRYPLDGRYVPARPPKIRRIGIRPLEFGSNQRGDRRHKIRISKTQCDRV